MTNSWTDWSHYAFTAPVSGTYTITAGTTSTTAALEAGTRYSQKDFERFIWNANPISKTAISKTLFKRKHGYDYDETD